MRELGSYSPSHLIELILLVIHKNLPSILPSAIFFSWNLHAEMSLSPTYAEHACACKCIISINLEVYIIIIILCTQNTFSSFLVSYIIMFGVAKIGARARAIYL